MNKYLLIGILMFPLSLSGQDFSVESVINYTHAISQESWGESHDHCRSVLESKRQQLINEHKYRNQPIIISVPDSLAEEWFRINKGESVVQIYDGKIIGSDTISGFEAMMDPNGNIIFHFKLHRMENRHLDWYDTGGACYFYVIGANDVKISPLSFHADPLNHWLLMKVNDYFEKHKDTEAVNRLFRPDTEQESDLLKLDRMKVALKDFCEAKLISSHIDNDQDLDYIFTSHTKTSECTFRDFSFIIVSSLNSPFLIPSSNFTYEVEVNTSKYLLFRVWVPDTGGRGWNLYALDPEKNNMKCVFGDWTWSD